MNNIGVNHTTNAGGTVTINSYSFTFSDYGVGNCIQLPNATIGTPITVTISPNVVLDSTGAMSNNNGPYGAGSSNANEIWPALYERAYAKFCYYETGITQPSTGAVLTEANLTNTAFDPTFSDVQSLTAAQWGGSGVMALMYLTGLPCFPLSTQTTAFPTGTTGGVTGNIGTNANSLSSWSAAATASLKGTPLTSMCGLYYYVLNGLCSEGTKVYGLYKTRYPVTAISGNPTVSPTVTFGSGTIVPNHNYSVLGVFDAPNGYHYFVLRNTFGTNPPSYPNPAANLNAGSVVASGAWSLPSSSTSPAPYDAEFLMQGGVTAAPQYPTSTRVAHLPMSFNFSPTTLNGVFALEQGAFINYFQSLGWAQGY
jgi:hypothetical protein